MLIFTRLIFKILYYQLLLFHERVPSVYVPRTLVNIQLGGVSTNSLFSYAKGWSEALWIYLTLFQFMGVIFFVGKILFKVPLSEIFGQFKKADFVSCP